MADDDILDVRKVMQECGHANIQNVAKEPDAGVEDAEEFFQCANDLAMKENKDVIVGTQDVTDTTQTTRDSFGRERATPKQTEKGERLIATDTVQGIVQDTHNIKSDPAMGPRTEVKDEKVVDEHEAFGKAMEIFDREKRGGGF